MATCHHALPMFLPTEARAGGIPAAAGLRAKPISFGRHSMLAIRCLIDPIIVDLALLNTGGRRWQHGAAELPIRTGAAYNSSNASRRLITIRRGQRPTPSLKSYHHSGEKTS